MIKWIGDLRSSVKGEFAVFKFSSFAVGGGGGGGQDGGMADLWTVLAGRKSIRKYRPDPVPREVLERILEAGMEAPSGKNRQNWRFFVVQGGKREAYLAYSQRSWLGLKESLRERLKPSLYAFTERFFYTLGEARVIIFCYALVEPGERYLTSVGSVYMAVENMILAAGALGLGTCAMGAPLEIQEEVDGFLGIAEQPVPEGGRLELLCGLVVGYADHDPPKAPRQREGRVVWLE